LKKRVLRFLPIFSLKLVERFSKNERKKRPYTTEKKALKPKKNNDLGVFFVIHI